MAIAGRVIRVPFLPQSRRALLAFLHDVAMAALSFALSLYLRLGDEALGREPRLTLVYGIVFTAIAAAIFLMTGLYRGIWRYASLPDLINIARAATLTELVFLPVMFLFTRLDALPRSLLLIDWLVLIALLGGPRLGYRLIKDGSLAHLLERDRSGSVPVLLISARDGADTFIRETERDPNAVYRVVGMLSDTPARVGRQIYGVPVLGTIDELESVVATLDRAGRRPQKLVLTAQGVDGGMDGAEVRRLLDRADALAIPLARAPRSTEIQQTRADARREVEPIALEDLLGRSQAVLDREAMAQLIRGRRILVTGAGGTIGSELTRQIAALAPSSLVLVDNSEYLLYTIDSELRDRQPGLAIRPLLADVRDRARIETVIGAERPQIVFHAAALKHVPMVEFEPGRGRADQRHRQPQRRRGGAGLRRRAGRDDLDRQGGRSGERDGCHQAPRRRHLPGPRPAGGAPAGSKTAECGHPVCHGAVWQCAGIDRVGRAAIHPPARRRRPADRDPPRGQPVFHDGARGRRTGARSLGNRPGRP